MKVKMSELSGVGLDWAVALAAGRINRWIDLGGGTSVSDVAIFQGKLWEYVGGRPDYKPWAPTIDWAQAGPIIEREKIKVSPNVSGKWSAQIRHETEHPLVSHKVLAGWTNSSGPTPLIAAMRCYVASKLGDEVEIPDIFVQGDKL